MYEGPGGQTGAGGTGYGGGAGGPGYAGSGAGPGYGGGWGRGGMMGARGPRPTYPIETKPFFLTSEFLLGVLAFLGLLITSLISDSIDARAFWTLLTVLLSFYMLSRGIAKSGTKSRSWDPREDPELLRRSGGSGAGGDR
jgi:hypothetical protein